MRDMGEVQETHGGGDSVRSGALDESPDVTFRQGTDITESGKAGLLIHVHT